MMILEIALIAMQLMILRRVVTSSIWSSERHETDSIKVVYATIFMSALITSALASIYLMSGTVDDINVLMRAGVLAVLSLYSLTACHIISIFDKSRISKRNATNANARPAAI